METRRFPSLGEEVSLLGYGCMRFPTLPGGEIDEPRAEALLDRALALGVNYFDTAWPYHDGKSEAFVGRVLKKHPRDRFFLATKLPSWELKSPADPERIFTEQLRRCQVDYFDFYLAHNLDEEHYALFEAAEGYDFLARMKAEGKIRHLGFSFHDTPRHLERVLNDHAWDFVQIQLNYLDWTFQAAKGKMELLKEYDIPVWVMEPLRGGSLAKLDDEATEKLKALRPEESIPAWAFRFLQSIPEVTMVLSGMSNMEQMQENIRTFEEDKPLSETEMRNLLAMADEMVKKIVLPCTACHYCVSHCPQGLPIPELLALYNEHCFTEGGFIAPMALSAYPQEKLPSACIGCRSCEAVCPQQLKISEAMADFAAKLGA